MQVQLAPQAEQVVRVAEQPLDAAEHAQGSVRASRLVDAQLLASIQRQEPQISHLRVRLHHEVQEVAGLHDYREPHTGCPPASAPPMGRSSEDVLLSGPDSL